MNPLLPFIMAGDPSLEALPRLLAEAKALGLEAIELGLPHSCYATNAEAAAASHYRCRDANAVRMR